MFENKKIFVLGMARSGYEVAKLLASKNCQVLITDIKEQDSKKVEELKKLGVNYQITDKPEDLLDNTYNYIVKNPGINSSKHPCIIKAKQLGIKVVNEMEVAYSFIDKNVKIIGITGSNGKTTTTTLIYEILKKANMPVHLGGNIGIPLSSIVRDIRHNDIVVLEISSHQLVDLDKFKTNISVLTNISEAHLDFFGNYENYIQNKKRIFNNQTSDDLLILNKDDQNVLKLSNDIKSRKLYFSKSSAGNAYINHNAIYYNNEEIIRLNNIKLRGMHNYENVMCAILVAKQLKVSNSTINKVLNEFNGVEHRLEYVCERNRRFFYNDSKATNTKSTTIALSSFNTPVILLLGGLERNQKFEDLNNYVKNVKYIISFGETKNRIEKWANSINIDCIVADTLTEATRAAYNVSKKEDTILLSPACASWDQYKSFEERGVEFKDLVQEIK